MELLQPSLGLLFWTLIAFIVVYVILRRYAWKPILESLNERQKTISDSLATAEKVKADMALLKSENEALLAKAREERAGMIKDAKIISDKMISDAKDHGKNEYDRIIRDAQAAIEQQKMAALVDVKNQVGNLVMEVAEKVLRRELSNKSDQETYIRQLADEVKFN